MNNLRLSRILLILFLVTSLIPVLGIIYYGKTVVTGIFIDNVKDNLSHIADIKVNAVEDYIRTKISLMEYQSHSLSAVIGLEKLSQISKSDQSLNEYIKHEDLLNEHYTELARVEGIYDIFLITKEGDIVYSLLHEDDVHTNLYTGKYNTSELAKAFDMSLFLITTQISRIKYYDTSQDYAIFLSTPIVVNGEIKGVLAFQLRAVTVVDFISDTTGMGFTGESIIKENSKADTLKLNTQNPLLFQHYDSKALRLGAKGYSGEGVTMDYDETEVVASWRYLPSLQWGLVVKQDLQEALAPLDTISNKLLLILVLILIFLTTVAAILGKNILAPIKHLEESISSLLASGSLRTLKSEGFKEAQDLTRSFNYLITDLKNHQENMEALVETKTKDLKTASYIIDSTQQAIVVTNKEGIITDVNPAYCHLFGYLKEELIGQNPSILNSYRQDSEFYKHMWEVLLENGQWTGEIWNLNKMGDEIPVLLSISIVSERQNDESYFVGILTNIEEIKAQEDVLHQMAYYDRLTGLPNRQLMYEHLKQNIKYSQRHKTMAAVMFIDLDRFKNVNDSLGHSAGDELLKVISSRLNDAIRISDTVARIGGDEFVVLLNDIVSVDDVEAIAQNIIHSVSHVVHIKKNTVYVGASIGIAFYPSDGQDLEVLLSNADIALYEAKESGRGIYRLFSSEGHEFDAVSSIQLESDLRQVIESQQLELYFQPQVDAKTGLLKGAEALIRWIHPEKGFIPPDLFIPIAESTGFIEKIDHWVLVTASKQLNKWQGHLSEDFKLSINLSARYFMQPNLLVDIQKYILDAGIDPSFLELEVTERTVMRSAEEVIDIMHQLQALNVSLSIDDFGTGYSSLSYLKEFPISTLKIDKSFVDGIPNDESDVAIAQTVINLAKSLNLTIIAEGVETEEQQLFLAKNNCDIIQGYFYSKPLEVSEFEKHWLKL